MEFFRLPMSVQTDICLQITKYAGLNEANGSNFAFSPFSMYVGLSLQACGSSGRTLEQMLTFLKPDGVDHLKSVGSRLVDSVNGTWITGGPNLSFINGVWVDKSLTLKPSFKDTMNAIYRAKAEAVDFRNKPHEVVEIVNTWVDKETNGLIKDLLPRESIDHNKRIVITNALYFKGVWNEAFHRSNTRNSEFYLLDGNSVQVSFMTSRNDQFISSFNDFKVLKLPYKQGQSDPRSFSMYIFLPDERDGLQNLIEKVGSDSGFLDRHLPERQVKVRDFRVPKFKISFGFEASRVLNELGLVLPFNKNEAELTEMVTSPRDGGKLYVSGVYHKCFVEVDEAGTEAAAATAIIIQLQCLSNIAPIDFVADHPFMFMIRDDLNGVLLFMGHVINPLSEGN